MTQRRPHVAARQKTDDTFDSTLPPWEKSFPSVPYMASSASPLSSAEREALPALWAANNHEQGQFGRLRSSPQGSSPTTMSPSSVQEHPNNTWSPPQRESQDGPGRTMSHSTTGNSITTSSTTGDGITSIDEHTRVQPFPGTMSTSNFDRRTTRRNRKGADHGVWSPATHKKNQATLTKRLRTTLHGMFKRTPVDESEFERIVDHHWTEEQSPI